MRKGTVLVACLRIELLSPSLKNSTVRITKKMTDATRENIVPYDPLCMMLPTMITQCGMLDNTRFRVLLRIEDVHKVIFTVVTEWFSDLSSLHRLP